MESRESIEARSQRIREHLHRAFGVRAPKLDKAVQKTGRRLPRQLRRCARQLVRAEAVTGNLEILRQLDSAALEQAETRLVEYLATVDRDAHRRTVRLNRLGGIVFNLLIIATAFLVWLIHNGHV